MKSIDVRHDKLHWCASELRRRTHWTEFARFIFCGAIRAGMGFIIYVCLLWLCSYGVAYTISYVPGIFISYWLNAKFVFEEPLRLGRALQYPLVYLVQYLLGLSLLFLLVEVVHLSEIVSPLLVIVVTVPITFLLSRYLIRRSFGLGQRQRATDL
jgi:putative flippase GtrA